MLVQCIESLYHNGKMIGIELERKREETTVKVVAFGVSSCLQLPGPQSLNKLPVSILK